MIDCAGTNNGQTFQTHPLASGASSAPHRCGATEPSTGRPCRRRVVAPDARWSLHSEHATTDANAADDPTEGTQLGLHTTADAFLEGLEERTREGLQAAFQRYHDGCAAELQALTRAALSVLEPDAIRPLCARGHHGSAAADRRPRSTSPR